MSDHIFICESVSHDGKPLRVDRERGIVYDVKITGLISKNRREYADKAVRDGFKRYEGAVAHLDHPSFVSQSNPAAGFTSGEHFNRPLTDRFAIFSGITYKPGDGIYAAEMKCDLDHPWTKSFLWWAENAPDKLALSHVVKGKRSHDAKRNVYVYESIDEVLSVDVVAKGGTTATLFESYSGMNENEDLGQFVRSLIGEGVSVGDIKSQLSTMLKNLPPREFKGTVAEAMTALQETVDPRVRIVVESLDSRLAKEARDAVRSKAEQACRDAKLQPELVTAVFVESLTRDSEANWAASIEDRRKLAVSGNSENTRALGGDASKLTIDEFCAKVRSGK